MAKKGQKFRMFSDKERTEITMKYINSSGSYQSIANEYGISKKTVESMVAKYRKTGSVKNDIFHNRGRPKESEIDYKERYNILKKFQAFLKAQRERK